MNAWRMMVGLGMAVALCGGAAMAQCSRVITVPVSPTGFNVLVQGEQVTGVYPDLLRQLGAEAGCQFVFPSYPRARLVRQFMESDEVDLLIPASRSAERDGKGVFVPLLRRKLALITPKTAPHGIQDVRALLMRTDWRAAVVRSYSWGAAYDELLKELEAGKRVDYVSDLRTVGLMLRSGRVQFTILPPTLLYSALNTDGEGKPRSLQDALKDFRFQPLEGLPPSEGGAYLSSAALSRQDLSLLRELLLRSARDGRLLRIFEHYYPAEVLQADLVLGP